MQANAAHLAVDIVPAAGLVIHQIDRHRLPAETGSDRADKGGLIGGPVDPGHSARIRSGQRPSGQIKAIPRLWHAREIARLLQGVAVGGIGRQPAAILRQSRHPAADRHGQHRGCARSPGARHQRRAILPAITGGDGHALEKPVAPGLPRLDAPVIQRGAVATGAVERGTHVAQFVGFRKGDAVDQRTDRMARARGIHRNLHRRGGGLHGEGKPQRRGQKQSAQHTRAPCVLAKPMRQEAMAAITVSSPGASVSGLNGEISTA